MEEKVTDRLVHLSFVKLKSGISKVVLELTDELTRVYLDRPAAVPFSHQTARVDPRRVAVRELLSKPAPPNSHCLRVDPRVTDE
ncbi:hypothetical protein YC2023_110897 [Brassica napus]